MSSSGSAPLRNNNGPPILYVFDDSVDLRRDFPALPQNSQVFLCPLTTHQECIDLIEKRWQAQGPGLIKRVGYLHHFDAKAFEKKEEFVRFISAFASAPRFQKKNLKEYFKCPAKNFSLWWLSLVAERNPLKSNSYTQLISLLTILDLREQYHCQELWLDIDNPPLAQTILNNQTADFICRNLKTTLIIPEGLYGLLHFLKGLWRYTVLVFKSLVIRMHIRNSPVRRANLQKSRYLLVTYFPFIEEAALKRKEFINKFYGPLQRSLEEKYRGQISWLAISVKVDEFRFWKSVRLGKGINDFSPNLFFYQESASLRAFGKALWQYFFIAFRFLRLAAVLRKSFRFPGRDLILWPLFRKEWYSSFCGTRLAEGLNYYHCFSSFLKRLPPKTNVLYFAEMQAWEKALNAAAQERKDLKIIGFQHASISWLHLMYFNDRQDLEGDDYIQKMPKPHFLACVGDLALKLFRGSGWNDKRTFVLGPVRFQHFRHHLANRIEWDKRENEIVVALSISPFEAKEILDYVYFAAKALKGRKVLIKEHPFCPLGRVRKFLNGRFNSSLFEFVQTPLSELLRRTKVLIVTESSAAIEGISCHCRVVVPKLTCAVDLSPLTRVSDLPIFVHSPAELAGVIGEMLHRPPPADYYERCRDFIEHYCAFADKDGDFIVRIEKTCVSY